MTPELHHLNNHLFQTYNQSYTPVLNSFRNSLLSHDRFNYISDVTKFIRLYNEEKTFQDLRIIEITFVGELKKPCKCVYWGVVSINFNQR